MKLKEFVEGYDIALKIFDALIQDLVQDPCPETSHAMARGLESYARIFRGVAEGKDVLTVLNQEIAKGNQTLSSGAPDA